jgi:uncharacterized membrane protein
VRLSGGDLIAFGGLVMLAGGLWLIWPPLAAVVLGVLLMALGVFLSLVRNP